MLFFFFPLDDLCCLFFFVARRDGGRGSSGQPVRPMMVLSFWGLVFVLLEHGNLGPLFYSASSNGNVKRCTSCCARLCSAALLFGPAEATQSRACLNVLIGSHPLCALLSALRVPAAGNALLPVRHTRTQLLNSVRCSEACVDEEGEGRQVARTGARESWSASWSSKIYEVAR